MTGRTDRIAFMHIPKTAGSSVVRAFVDALGPAQCTVFSPSIQAADFAGRRFVSGHVHLDDITPDARIVTVLRDPLRQLASHLRWIDHYTQPSHQAEAAGFPPGVQAAIDAIARTDLADPAAVDRFLAWLPAESEQRLINLQSEMLAFRRGHGFDPRAPDLADRAIASLPRLAFVALSEQLAQDLPTLFARLGLPPPTIRRINPSPATRRIDLDHPAMRRVLEHHLQADLRLYRQVTRQRHPGPLAWLRRKARGAS